MTNPGNDPITVGSESVNDQHVEDDGTVDQEVSFTGVDEVTGDPVHGDAHVSTDPEGESTIDATVTDDITGAAGFGEYSSDDHGV